MAHTVELRMTHKLQLSQRKHIMWKHNSPELEFFMYSKFSIDIEKLKAMSISRTFVNRVIDAALQFVITWLVAMKTEAHNSKEFERRDQPLVVRAGEEVVHQRLGQQVKVPNDGVDSGHVLLQVSDAKVAAPDGQRREVAQELLPERRTVDGQIFVDEFSNHFHFLVARGFALFLLVTQNRERRHANRR